MNALSDDTTPHLARGWSIARNTLYALIALPALLTVAFFAAYISSFLTPGSYDSILNPRIELVVAGVLTVIFLLPWRFLLCQPRCSSLLGSLLAEILVIASFMFLYLGGLLAIQLRTSNVSFTDSFRPSYDNWATMTCYSWYCHLDKAGMGSAWAAFGLLAVLLVFLIVYGFFHPYRWRLPFGEYSMPPFATRGLGLPSNHGAERNQPEFPEETSGTDERAILMHREESDMEKGNMNAITREERDGHNVN